MKKLLTSSALVFGIIAATLTATPQPAFADPGGCNGCVVDQPSDTIPSEPKDGQGCSNCAIHVRALKLADAGCNQCVVDQPSDAIPADPKDNRRLQRLRHSDTACAEAG
jgi:hypothetical protein